MSKKFHRHSRTFVVALCAVALLALDAAVSYTLGGIWRSFSAASFSFAGNLPERVGDFALLDQEGRYHRLYRYGMSYRAVVLLAFEVGCHVQGSSISTFKTLRNRYAEQGVAFFLIDPSSQDDREELKLEAARLGIDMPILSDATQLVTESLGIKHTNEAVVIDTRSWQVVYRGGVDEQIRPYHATDDVGQQYLRNAIEAVLAGRPGLRPDSVNSAGCPIAVNNKDHASYSDVAPILIHKCLSCHQQGSVTPVVMDRYETVRAWSERIRNAVMIRRMPPWHADPAYGSFSGDRSLSNAQIRRLIRWIDAGSLRGNGPDPLSAARLPIQQKWPLGKPDLLLKLPVQSVQARGVIEYHAVDVPLTLDRDMWVRAVDVKPSNRAVTHHILVFVIYPQHLRHRQPVWNAENNFFAAYAPGLLVEPFPNNTGQFLPKGSILKFQLHYNAIGHVAIDTPRLALYFHKSPPARELVVESASNVDFRIPASTEDYPVEARYVFKRDARLHAMLPHMHLRGSRISYEARYSDGRREVLLSVPKYEVAWQTLYSLRPPKPMPAGTEILVRGAFDNSSLNPANPDPSKVVGFAHQTWDEMFIGYLLYSVPRTVKGVSLPTGMPIVR